VTSVVEINLIDESAKAQLEKVNEIVKNFAAGDKTVLLTKDEMLVKVIPMLAVKNKIKMKIKMSEDIWNITLERSENV
tara:strand:+ start:91 stop:324 length:234 start_codon:yes stop_codon:yes gene_type:complete